MGIFDDKKIDIIEREYISYNIMYDTMDFDKFKKIVIDEYETVIKYNR